MKWSSALVVTALVASLAASAYGKVPVVERVCEANASWKEDCNDCICGEDLKPMCTRRDCSPTTTTPQPGACRPGTTWKQGCNTCHCMGLGASVCTQMACLDDGLGLEPGSPVAEPPLPGRPGMGAVCRPGHVWKQDCNTCRCVGGRSLCTMMACIGTTTPASNECTPGDIWKDRCNTCTCSSTGMAMCTMMACLSKREAADSSSSESQSSSSSEEQQGLGDRCQPGAPSWKKECNTCRCTPSGHAACTKMRCVKPPQEPYSEQPLGQPQEP